MLVVGATNTVAEQFLDAVPDHLSAGKKNGHSACHGVKCVITIHMYIGPGALWSRQNVWNGDVSANASVPEMDVPIQCVAKRLRAALMKQYPPER